MKRTVEQSEGAAVAIVGGGAAGLAAAIVAGEALRERGGRVVVCEASDRVGRSILATGNGRCNFSNARLTEAVLRDATALEPLYRNAEFASRVFAALEELHLFGRDASERASFGSPCANAVLRFFADHGLVWREESEGRLYPLANKASSVLDVLRAAVEAAQVETLIEFSAQTITKEPDGFLLRAVDGRELHAPRVIIATGGSVSEGLVDALCLPFVDQRSVLGPLAVEAKDKRIAKRLDNIRTKAAASLLRDGSTIRCEQGEVLFRSYGLSGIAVFDLSRVAVVGDVVSLDLLPQVPLERTANFLKARAEQLCEHGVKRAVYESVLRGVVLPQVAAVLCERAQVKIDGTCDTEGVMRLAHVLHDLRFTVEGIGDTRQCQVRRGGIAVTSCDSATLGVATIPGLYVTGEALDVDAACGGFNLHWAWASGMLAGFAAARAVLCASKED